MNASSHKAPTNRGVYPEGSEMKIAFVNQPIDTILPPYQSSGGACTYGAACSLAKHCEVVAYGTSNRHKHVPADYREHNVHFRFFPVPLSDRLAAFENFTWDIVAERMYRYYADLCGMKNQGADIGILKA